ncbi:MAG: endonuclease III [Clostridia bacterium]|nr:endonuclease III [Clostridia bacterium]
MPTKKARLAREFCERLEKIYPEAQCALEFGGEAWKLLIMGRLSAQCTDARVNIVCRELFEKYPTLESVADCELSELESVVRPCGLYKTKAKNIKDACIMLRDEYGGELPDTMDELLRLPGVGRKIANLLLGDIFGKPAIVTDTHCIRICGRVGLYPETLKDPVKIEKILIPLIIPEKQSDFCHRVVMFGRDTCTARSPKCGQCLCVDICKHAVSGHFL